MDNESFRRRSHIRERIAGYERQLGIRRLTKDLHVRRIDDLDRIYDISEGSVGSGDENFVVSPHVTQRAKEGITMSGDTDIARGPRKSSTVDVSRGHSKDFRSRTFENHHREMKTRNLDSSDRLSRARRNDDESVRKRSGREWPRISRLLVLDNPTRRTLRTEHAALEVRIPGKSECAPDKEGASEIEQEFLHHGRTPLSSAWLRIEVR